MQFRFLVNGRNSAEEILISIFPYVNNNFILSSYIGNMCKYCRLYLFLTANHSIYLILISGGEIKNSML